MANEAPLNKDAVTPERIEFVPSAHQGQASNSNALPPIAEASFEHSYAGSELSRNQEEGNVNWGYEDQQREGYNNPQQYPMAQQPAGQQQFMAQQQQQQYVAQQQYAAPQQQYVAQHPMPQIAGQQLLAWMPAPMIPVGLTCPPGLEYFSMLNQLVVKQRIELLEAFTGYEQQNKYDIFNIYGQLIYRAKEESECCQRNYCGPNRTFDMRFLDEYDREVIHFRRPFACACFNACCLSELTVEAPVGAPVGIVRQMPGNCKIRFHVECPIGKHVATVECPHWCKCFCFSDVPYHIKDLQGRDIGRIMRKLTLKGWLTDADNFTIEFDPTLDVWLKACLMGSLFLVDFMFYEQSGKAGRHSL